MTGQLTCTIVQTELLWENIDGNLKLLSEKLKGVSSSDLILLPEMFTTGFTMNPANLAERMDGKTVSWMLKTAEVSSVVVGGSLIIEEEGKFFNRFVLAYPEGSIKWYDKKHLFTLGREHEPYESGNERLIVEVNGWRVFPLICYDLRFPVWARSQKSESTAWEYDLLVYSANWPTVRMNAWDSLLKARAIENQAYCIGVNRIGTDPNDLEYSGHSAAYDYLGNFLIDMDDRDELGTVTLKKEDLLSFREKLPFVEDADDFRFLS